MAFKNKEDQAKYHREVWYPRNKKRRLELNSAWRNEQIRKYKEYKSTLFCAICGEKETVCLEFHHKDANKKDMSVAEMRSHSFEKILEEIDKCVILCANCHRKVHAGLVQLEEQGLCNP